MDISKSLCVTDLYNYQRMSLNWGEIIFAKLVFLDKSHCSSIPQLYQLNDSVLASHLHRMSHVNMSSHRDEFLHLGEVEGIDKTNKRIYLSNKNSVSYDHIVIISGSKYSLASPTPLFSTRLQALKAALKVKPKIFSSTHHCAKNHTRKKSMHRDRDRSAFEQKSDVEIKKNIHSYILKMNGNLPKANFMTHFLRIYEIQL